MWPLRIALARLRPFDAATMVKAAIVFVLFSSLMVGDYLLCRRVIRAIATIEPLTPVVAFALLRGMLSLLLLVATAVLFSSALTSAIGSFFTDLDLETYHAAPVGRSRIVLSRWGKTLVQAGTMVFLFFLPLIVALGVQYRTPLSFYVLAVIDLAMLLTMPVSVASLAIVTLVRFFPVRRVHQIVASLAVLVLVVVVVGFRMSRPERFFRDLGDADVRAVLRMVDLPRMDVYPSSWMAAAVVDAAHDRSAPVFVWRYVALATAVFALFFSMVRSVYFRAFVRARETMAPVALGSSPVMRFVDRIPVGSDAVMRTLIGKEVRILTRDVAQWSQLFLMVALLFLYLYNIQMLPLTGDARATIVAYVNVAMAGFVVAAICLRFAYPSVSSEGRAFWIMQAAPISYRRLLFSKVLVYGAPLTLLSLLLTITANVLLNAGRTVWITTLIGAFLVGITLVSLGVALGALAPQFDAENPLQVGLSLGGFGYMGAALLYVGAILFLLARPAQELILHILLGINLERSLLGHIGPPAAGVALSMLLATLPLELAARKLERRDRN
jgi:ABC-2 type transport system permease protein